MRAYFLFAVAILSPLNASFCQVPKSHHVYIVAEENHSYESIVGSPSMPYLNNLISHGGLATQFYANQHSSLPNYFWVTSGHFITNDNETTATFDVDNIVRRVMQMGLTYKSYAESLPNPGFAGLYSGPYLKRHAPLPYFTDMGNSTVEMQKHVPLTQWTSDVSQGTLPDFAFLTPDSLHDMHDCPDGLDACLKMADGWLQANIGPLLARPEFQPGGDGLLILWADEADLDTDNRCSATVADGCGGRIAVALIGPQVKPGYQSTATYHHPSLLRTMLEALGTTDNFPAEANSARDMAEFFTTPGAPGATINVASPSPGATVGSPMHVIASASAANPIVAIQIYIDDALVTTTGASHIDINVPIQPGPHKVVVQAWDSTGVPYKKQLTINGAAPPWIEITSPAPDSSMGPAVHVTANAGGPVPIVAVQAYIDNQLAYTAQGAHIDVWLPVGAGRHNLVVQSWDAAGQFFKKSLTFVSAGSGILITSPASNSVSVPLVHVAASAISFNPIDAIVVYVDDKWMYKSSAAQIDTSLLLGAGTHNIVVQSWDKSGNISKSNVSVTVR